MQILYRSRYTAREFQESCLHRRSRLILSILLLLKAVKKLHTSDRFYIRQRQVGTGIRIVNVRCQRDRIFAVHTVVQSLYFNIRRDFCIKIKIGRPYLDQNMNRGFEEFRQNLCLIFYNTVV